MHQNEATTMQRELVLLLLVIVAHGWSSLSVTQSDLWTFHQEGRTKFSSLFVTHQDACKKIIQIHHPPHYTPPFWR